MPLNEELVEKAKELEITYEDDIDDDKLTALIREEEEEIKMNRDPEYLESELQKAIKRRDDAKREKRLLKEKLDAATEDLKKAKENASDPEEVKKLKDDLKELKAFKKEMDEKNEAEELKNKTEKERLEVGFNKELRKFKEQLAELQSENTKIIENRDVEIAKMKKTSEALRRHSLDAEIIKHAVKNDALKPEQIVRLTRSEFEWDDQEEDFIYLKKDKKGKVIDELSVAEFISEYLSDEENENLIRGDVKKGFKTEKKTGEKTPTKDSDLKIDDQIKKEAESRDLPPEVWAKIKAKQDAKLSRNKK